MSERKRKKKKSKRFQRVGHGLFGLAVELGAILEHTAHEVQLMREEIPERLTPIWQQAQTILQEVKRPKGKCVMEGDVLAA